MVFASNNESVNTKSVASGWLRIQKSYRAACKRTDEQEKKIHTLSFIKCIYILLQVKNPLSKDDSDCCRRIQVKNSQLISLHSLSTRTFLVGLAHHLKYYKDMHSMGVSV